MSVTIPASDLGSELRGTGMTIKRIAAFFASAALIVAGASIGQGSSDGFEWTSQGSTDGFEWN